MVTKRVIVPPRLSGGPGDGPAPSAVDSSAMPLGAPIDPGPPTMPLDPQMPLPSASLDDAPVEAAERPRRMTRDDMPDDLADDLDAAPAGAVSAFWPLLLLASSWLVWMGYHTWQLERDRQSLASLRTQLEQPYARSAQLRQALDTLAADTKRLADAGNPSARLVIDELKRRGVTIDPSAAGASAPK